MKVHEAQLLGQHIIGRRVWHKETGELFVVTGYDMDNPRSPNPIRLKGRKAMPIYDRLENLSFSEILPIEKIYSARGRKWMDYTPNQRNVLTELYRLKTDYGEWVRPKHIRVELHNVGIANVLRTLAKYRLVKERMRYDKKKRRYYKEWSITVTGEYFVDRGRDVNK